MSLPSPYDFIKTRHQSGWQKIEWASFKDCSLHMIRKSKLTFKKIAGIFFNPGSYPRILLIFPAIVVMLLSMLLSGLAFSYDSGIFALAGMLVAIVWLGFLVLIALPGTDKVLAGQRWLHPLSKGLMACLLVAGVVEFGAIIAINSGSAGNGILGGATPQFMKTIPGDIAYSDSDALLYQAVDNLMHGKNPYAEANVVTAILALKSPPGKITPLRAGTLENVFPYPSQDQYTQIWHEAIQSPAQSSPAIESTLGYPAGFFVIPALFMFLGINNLRLIMLILTLPAVMYAVAVCRPDLRLWLVGAFLGSLAIWNSIASGLTGALYFPFLLLAWVLWRRNFWLSAVFMGLAIAAKELAWYFLPFYLILILRNSGWKRGFEAGVLAGGIFLVLNLPFIMGGPGLWLGSVFSLLKDPLFPSGTGVVTLVTFSVVNIHSSLLFTVSEIVVMVGGMVWYWFKAERYPGIGVILSVIPIFFAWRSLWPYFFYTDVILLAMIMANEYGTGRGNLEIEGNIT